MFLLVQLSTCFIKLQQLLHHYHDSTSFLMQEILLNGTQKPHEFCFVDVWNEISSNWSVCKSWYKKKYAKLQNGVFGFSFFLCCKYTCSSSPSLCPSLYPIPSPKFQQKKATTTIDSNREIFAYVCCVIYQSIVMWMCICERKRRIDRQKESESVRREIQDALQIKAI